MSYEKIPTVQKNLWKTIKRCYPTKSNGANPNKLLNINGETFSDIKRISEGFCTYFSTALKHYNKAWYLLLTEYGVIALI